MRNSTLLIKIYLSDGDEIRKRVQDVGILNYTNKRDRYYILLLLIQGDKQ